MKSVINRRGFLKLASLLPFATPFLSGSGPILKGSKTDADNPNVIILVFDAFSALDASLYGFTRQTTPNLTLFADRANVYHSHYSAGNFTTPGTSSILSGTYPWTHRAFTLYNTMVDSFRAKNIFSEFKSSDYTRIGFTHNFFASIVLDHLKNNIDEFILPNEVTWIDFDFFNTIFSGDYGVAAHSMQRYLKKPGMYPDSLFLYPIYKTIRDKIVELQDMQNIEKFPLGVPRYRDTIFPLEDTLDWLMEQIRHKWPQPFLAYLHMMPPHDPYRPRIEFTSLFLDGWHPESKPDHFFANFKDHQHVLDGLRVTYDQYITYVDAEFGRLHDFFQAGGIYENSIVVVTSDHGELFERMIWQHNTPVLFQPIIRVPLLISIPGQITRQDIYTSTSAVDILPTMLYLTGRPIPEWTEGQVLPPFVTNDDSPKRSIYAVEAKGNPKTAPLRKATLAMIKGDYKIIYYRGYQGHDGVFELYNLKQDPEELNDLYDTNSAIASELKFELLAKIEEKDAPFMQTTT